MEILAHRGYWKFPAEKNTKAAMQKAFDNQFGIETDIRDYQGRLVVSHGIANEHCMTVENLFALYNTSGCRKTMALNVKADGLQDLLGELLDKYQISHYFMFDMSVPEQILYRDRHFSYYTRQSDVESRCVLYDQADGIWMDSFFDEEWLTASVMDAHLAEGKCIGIISPELHEKNYKKTWEMLKNYAYDKNDAVKLCTDLPAMAKEFFYGEN